MVAAILIGVFCALMPNTLPVYLSVLARLRGLTESQIGLVAMADMGGYALGIIGCALLPSLVVRLNWRRMSIVGALIMIIANILSIEVQAFLPFLFVRAIAGIGAGITTAIVYAIAAEGDGSRSMAFLVGTMLLSGSVAVPFLTPLTEKFGATGVFGVFAGLAAISILLIPLMPRDSIRTPESSEGANPISQKVTLPGWLAISSVFVHFCGIGAIYGFISSMGVAWGGSEMSVELDVSKMLFAGMVGVALVAIVGSRFGAFKSLVAAYAGLLVAIVLLLVLKPLAGFLAVSVFFGFVYNLLVPYQFDVVIQVDESSSAAMLVSGGMFTGVAVGPAIAGYLVTPDYVWVNGFGLVCCVLALALIALARRVRDKALATNTWVGTEKSA